MKSTDKKTIRLGVTECPTCGGSGKAFGITCGDCKGMGIVSVRQADKLSKP